MRSEAGSISVFSAHSHIVHQSDTSPASSSIITSSSPRRAPAAAAPGKRHSHGKTDQSRRDLSEEEEILSLNSSTLDNKHQQGRQGGEVESFGQLRHSSIQESPVEPNSAAGGFDSTITIVAGRQHQRRSSEKFKSTRSVQRTSSTVSTVSGTPSSPPSLSASTTPSSTASSLPSSIVPFEEPTSPCPSESTTSILSVSTLSSPISATFNIERPTKRKRKMATSSALSTTGTETRRTSGSHTRNASGGSSAGETSASLLLGPSNPSGSRRSGRKSATPSAINIAAANSQSNQSSNSAPSSSSASNAKQAISSALSGLLSPTSAQNLTKAQQSALEKALAAGISRDEFEKTRASVVSMLRGAAAAASSGSGNAGKERSVTPQPVAPLSASSTNTTATSADTSLANASEAIDETAAQRSFDGLPPRLAISTSRRENNGSGSRSARHSLNSASTSTSTSQTALSEPASTAPSTAASTLRTSVSSSNGGEEDRHFANSSSTGGLGNGHDSPATSHDGNEGGEDMMQMHLDQSSSSASMAEKGRTRAQTPEKHAILDDEMMLSSVEKSITNGDIEEDDSSFNAATAAAAALGMLASSPVKVIERRPSSTTTTNNTQYQHQPFMNGASGVFSQHRGHGNGQLVSSSSPPLAARGSGGAGNALAQGLSASSSTGHLYSSPSRSPLDNSRLGNDSSDLSAEGLVAAATLGATATLSASGSDADARRRGDKSTTPVRTRLEDIALKSSAQIRRQREILGLGEEEMMDLDTDARHENALLRGQFDADEEEEEEYVDDDSEEMLRRTSSRRQSSRRRNDATRAAESESLSLRGLAPAFSYPHPASSSSASVSRKASRSPSRPVITNGRDGRSAHSRQSSRHVGAQASSSSHFSPSKLASAHLPSSTHSSHHYASSSVAPPTSSSSTTAVSTSRRRGHHRRVSSFGMSGMMDRFMESNYSPKAAQIAKFEEAVRRASPEREGRSSAHPSSSAYDTDRTLMHAGPEGEDEEEDVYYEEAEDDENAVEDREDVTIHSTPRTHMDKTRLLRSAGNDLPSPLLQQIRMLSDADHSPRFSAERPLRERETPRFARGAAGYSARQELGLASGHGSSSEFGSARKRKASYDLQSPRHMVRNVQASPTPEEDEEGPRVSRGSRASSPPPFPSFAQSDPKFYERTAAGHPSSAGLFDGPTPSHSQSSSQSSAASYRLSQSQPHPSQHTARQAYAQQQQHHQQQHPRHYAEDGHGPPPHYGHPAQHQPPHSAERPHPQSAYYQQQYPPRHVDGADELSHYALAPPRPPSYHHMHGGLHASHMSRPESVSSDYIPNQRELKKKEKAARKSHMLQRERQDSVNSSTASGPVAGPSSAASASTLDNFVPANVQVGQYDENTKPPFSYAALIGQAIFSTPNRRMSLADIYTYIMTLYPFYKKQDAGWQNSIRHNLSLNECFVKTQRGPDEPGKGCLWSILPGTEEQFTGGNFYKKGKIPKSALKPSSGAGGDGGSSVAPSSTDDASLKRKKANSVASASETMSAMSADDSFETQSANSFSFASNSSMMQSQGYSDRGAPGHYAQHPAYAHQAYAGQHYQHQHPASQPHGPSSLRQKQQMQYSDEAEPEEVYEDDDDEAIDMDNPPARYTRPRQYLPSPGQRRHPQDQQLQEHRPKLVVKQPKAAAQGVEESSERRAKRESSPEGDAGDLSHAPSDYEHNDVFNVPEADHSFSNSDRSGSLEPVKRQQAISHTSPVRRGVPHPHDRQRALLTSPPIMSSPPTNVFARMSQPYQPLRTSFNIPAANAHAEALMSSPPPSSGIMPSDVRMRRLPPPTPRRTSNDGDPGSHIFLPAPNIKPGKASFSKKDATDDDSKPTLPPIHMMSPASAMALNTQSPVSSVRGSASQNRSSSPSPKSSSLPSSSGNSVTRSPTLNKSKHVHSSEVFKTPDRFAAPSARPISSPNKLAHLANNNASKALQSLQASTPKLGGSRPGHGLVTPGGYYDPYEYGAVLDEELDRMIATNKDDGGRADRRPLPFPSPIDRTPKWQPWSPW